MSLLQLAVNTGPPECFALKYLDIVFIHNHKVLRDNLNHFISW